MAMIYLCQHCGAKMGSDKKFCQECSTAEKRKAMDEANRQLFKENNLPEYHCKFCEKKND